MVSYIPVPIIERVLGQQLTFLLLIEHYKQQESTTKPRGLPITFLLRYKFFMGKGPGGRKTHNSTFNSRAAIKLSFIY